MPAGWDRKIRFSMENYDEGEDILLRPSYNRIEEYQKIILDTFKNEYKKGQKIDPVELAYSIAHFIDTELRVLEAKNGLEAGDSIIERHYKISEEY